MKIDNNLYRASIGLASETWITKVSDAVDRVTESIPLDPKQTERSDSRHQEP